MLRGSPMFEPVTCSRTNRYSETLDTFLFLRDLKLCVYLKWRHFTDSVAHCNKQVTCTPPPGAYSWLCQTASDVSKLQQEISVARTGVSAAIQ
jgi:hypothetical protein